MGGSSLSTFSILSLCVVTMLIGTTLLVHPVSGTHVSYLQLNGSSELALLKTCASNVGVGFGCPPIRIDLLDVIRLFLCDFFPFFLSFLADASELVLSSLSSSDAADVADVSVSFEAALRFLDFLFLFFFWKGELFRDWDFPLDLERPLFLSLFLCWVLLLSEFEGLGQSLFLCPGLLHL